MAEVILNSNREINDQILNLDDFSRRQNNFYLYFLGDTFTSNIYKGKEIYRRFVEKYPDMAASLNEKVYGADTGRDVAEGLKPFLGDLYDAYKLMRGLGASDRDLFQ